MQAFHSRLLSEEKPEDLVLTLACVAGIEIPEASIKAVSMHLKIAAEMAGVLFAANVAENDLALAGVFNPEQNAPE